MNFTMTRQNLAQALTAAAAPLRPGKQPALPVLSNVLLEALEDDLRVTGTDLDNWVRTSAPAEVKTPGSITVPGKKLQELSGLLPDNPVAVQMQGEQLEISCGRSRFKINGVASEEFPSVPELDFEGGWSVTSETMRNLVDRTTFAVATDASRPLLNGVLWELRDAEMTMVATDGHRLVSMSVETESKGRDAQDLIVSPAAFHHAQRLFSEENADISVAVEGNHIGFRQGSTDVYSRLFEGTYPNYRQVIPKDNDRVARAPREALERTIRRMAVITDAAAGRLKLSFAPERLHLNVETADLGEAHDELDVQYEGEPLEIAFRPGYLLDMLKRIPGDDVKMSFKTSEGAATMEPDGDFDYKFMSLVMPLH